MAEKVRPSGIINGRQQDFEQMHPSPNLASGQSHAQSCTDLPSVLQQQISQSTRDRKEVEGLRRELKETKDELEKYKRMVTELQKRESALKERVVLQAQRQIETSTKFEDISMGEKRPSQLIRMFSCLYAEGRVDAYDALDDLQDLHELDNLKEKLLFTVIVLSFRSVRDTLKKTWNQLFGLLSIPGSSSIDEDSSMTLERSQQTEHGSEIILRLKKYYKNTIDTVNLSKNVTEVSEKLFSTLSEYKSLPECQGLHSYIEDCVRVAWSLSVQTPAYKIQYDFETFQNGLHTRFHTSDPTSDAIEYVLWPALIDGAGECVHKATVVT